MSEHEPRFRVRLWVWPVLLTAGLIAAVAGLGFVALFLVAIAWLTATMLRIATRDTPTETTSGSTRPLQSGLRAASNWHSVSDLRAASDEWLCKMWATTTEEIRHAYLPSTMATYAEMRRGILDELFRRHPEGVQRWLDARAGQDDLLTYLHDQHT